MDKNFKKLLATWLEQIRKNDRQVLHEAFYGHCDAFAIALMRIIEREFPKTNTHFVVISRDRVEIESDKIVDENPFSHVLLSVDGILVDAGGVDADSSWEDNWIQPDEDDEEESCEDVFDYTTMNLDELTSLRRARDSRDPDKKMITKFTRSLEKSLVVAKGYGVAKKIRSPK